MALRKSSEHRSLTDCMQSMNLKCFRKRNMMFNDSWHSRRDPSIKDPRSNAAHDHFFELSQTWQKGIGRLQINTKIDIQPNSIPEWRGSHQREQDMLG